MAAIIPTFPINGETLRATLTDLRASTALQFSSIDALANATGLQEGDYCLTPAGRFVIVNISAADANDTTVVSLLGSSGLAMMVAADAIENRTILEADTRPPSWFTTGARLVVGLDVFQVADAEAGDAHLTTIGGLKLYEAGTTYSSLARFKEAVARGVSYPTGIGVFAGGGRYVYMGTEVTVVEGLPGWVREAQTAPKLRDAAAITQINFKERWAFVNGEWADFEAVIAQQSNVGGGNTSSRPFVENDGRLVTPSVSDLAFHADGALVVRENSENLIADPLFSEAVPSRTHWTDYASGSFPIAAISGSTFSGTQNGLASQISGTGVEDGWPYIEFKFVPNVALAPISTDLIWDIALPATTVYQNDIYTGSFHARVTLGDDVRLRTQAFQSGGFSRAADDRTLSESADRSQIVKTIPMRSGALDKLRIRMGITLTTETRIRIYAPQFEHKPFATEPLLAGVREEAFSVPALADQQAVDVVYIDGTGRQVLQERADLSADFPVTTKLWRNRELAEILVVPHQDQRSGFQRDDVANWQDARLGGTSFDAAMLAPRVTPYEPFLRVFHTEVDQPWAIRRSLDHISRWRFEVREDDFNSAQHTSSAYPLKAELQSPTGHDDEFTGAPAPGEDVWVSYAVRFGEHAPFDGEYFIAGQWHATEDRGSLGDPHDDVSTSPVMAFHLGTPRWGNQSDTPGSQLAALMVNETVQQESDRLFVFTYSDPAAEQTQNYATGSDYAVYDLSGGPIERGVWHHIVYRVRFGFNDNAELELWFNGEKKIDVTGVNIGHNDTIGPAWNYGIYAGWWNHSSEPHVVEYSNMEMSWPSRGGGSLLPRVSAPLPL